MSGKPASLILEDATLVIKLVAQSGSAAPDFTAATAVALFGVCRRLKVNRGMTKIDVSGAGDGSRRYRMTKHDGTCELESFVPTTGLTYVLAGVSLEGYFIQIVTHELSTLTTPQTYVGQIETWNWEGSVAAPQVETATICLYPDYDS